MEQLSECSGRIIVKKAFFSIQKVVTAEKNIINHDLQDDWDEKYYLHLSTLSLIAIKENGNLAWVLRSCFKNFSTDAHLTNNNTIHMIPSILIKHIIPMQIYIVVYLLLSFNPRLI